MGGFSGLILAGRQKVSARALASSQSVGRRLGALTGAAVVTDTPAGAVLLACDRGREPARPRNAPALVQSVRHLKILFDGRIDNRRDLIAELAPGIRSTAALSDGDIVRLAYAEWGEETPRRLSGPFAFAVYDEKLATCFCARDRFGQQPFFHGRNADGFLFATHMAALVAWPGISRAVDLDVLAHYLSFGFVRADKSLLRNAAILRPGHWLLLDRHGASRTQAYWSLARVDHARVPGSRAELEDEVRHRLQDTISRQIIDAESGSVVALDGGDLASAILARALAAAGQTAPVTSVARFGRTLDDQDVSAGLNRLTLAGGAPLAGLSAFALAQTARETSPHARRIVAAMAGNEIALAHPHYQRFGASLTEWRAAGPALRSVPFARDLYHHVAGLMSEEDRAGLAGPGMAHTLIFSPIDELGPSLETAGSEDAIDLAARIDIANLPSSSFSGAQAAFAATGVDLVLPFTDHIFADWYAALPQRLRSAGHDRGVDHPGLLQSSFPDVTPSPGAQTVQEENATLNAWLAAGLSEFMCDTFASTAFRSRGLFSLGAVEAMLASHLAGKRQHGRLLWSLLCIEAWFANLVDMPRHEARPGNGVREPALSDPVLEMTS
jgi:asparagine synthase (glutamine-hydrolysing)